MIVTGVTTAVALAALAGGVQAQPAPDAPLCAPDGVPVALAGSIGPDDAKTYQVHPFEVAPGTTRIEVSYGWSDPIGDLPAPGNPVTGLVQTVIDAGLWDHHGYRDVEGFRGWSGSRAGRTADGQDPIVVQQDVASRGYRPAPIAPGTWWLELGIAAVAPTGATWTGTITCTAPDVGAAFSSAPVDPNLVVDPDPGWYHADLHAHGYHSAGNAPAWDDIVDQARVAGLEVLPITEYVTGQHWDELGPVQVRNPDLLLWPGREIITYFGHAIVLGETRNVLEYRHGFEDVSMATIQDRTLADGALFGVAHPTTFAGPLFGSLCRGCEYTLDAVTDWSRVDTIEVLTGPVLATAAEAGVPFDPGARIANPFLRTAIERWDELLQAGFRITAVSGSDSKANEPEQERARVGIGSSATAILADELSRTALAEGLRAGHAYVRSLGALRSPELGIVATTADGSTAGIGDDLAADAAELAVTVTGGQGDRIVLVRNGQRFGSAIAVTSDPFTATVPIERHPASEGPLGTWVRVETIRTVEIVDGVAAPDHLVDLPLDVPADGDVLRFPTTIANPLFLTGTVADGGGDADGGAGGSSPDGRSDRSDPGPAAPPLPVTGSTGPSGVALIFLVAGILLVTRRAGSRRAGDGARQRAST